MFTKLLIIATITSFCSSTVTKTQVLKKSDYTKLIAFTAGAGVVACAASYKFPRITLGAYAGAFAAGNAAGYMIFRKQNKAFAEQIEQLKESNGTEAEIAELEKRNKKMKVLLLPPYQVQSLIHALALV